MAAEPIRSQNFEEPDCEICGMIEAEEIAASPLRAAPTLNSEHTPAITRYAGTTFRKPGGPLTWTQARVRGETNYALPQP